MQWLHPALEVGRRWWLLIPAALAAMTLAGAAGALLPCGGPMLAQYAEAIVAIIAAALAVLGAAVTDGIITPVEAVNIAIALFTAVGVYLAARYQGGSRAILVDGRVPRRSFASRIQSRTG